MKKVFFLLLAVSGTVFFLSSCHSGEQQKSDAAVDSTLKKMDLTISDTLAAKMNVVLDTYYQLKDALVAGDTVAADTAAKLLLNNIQPISLNEFQSDNNRYNKGRAALQSLDGELEGFLGEHTLLGRRKEFQMISDITYDLISTVGLKETTVYRDFCPMFNDDKGAYWLSANKRINNPYYGDEMLGCGEVKETLQF